MAHIHHGSGHHCQQIICDMVLTKHEIDYEGVSFERSSFNLAFFEAIKFLSL